MATKTSSKASTPKRKRTSTAPAAPTDVIDSDGAMMTESPKRAPTHEDIAFRAFELYQLRDYAEGGALNDWLTAERELRAS